MKDEPTNEDARQWRTGHRYTQKKMAKAIGASLGAYGNFERGKNPSGRMTPHHMQNLMRVMKWDEHEPTEEKKCCQAPAQMHGFLLQLTEGDMESKEVREKLSELMLIIRDDKKLEEAAAKAGANSKYAIPHRMKA